jgi:hypothetical protein
MFYYLFETLFFKLLASARLLNPDELFEYLKCSSKFSFSLLFHVFIFKFMHFEVY